MKKATLLIITICSCLVHGFMLAQDSLMVKEDISINNYIEGTLLIPNAKVRAPLAIIIAGSGPTDRDGNQNLMQNNSLKKLALGLANNNIATFRYDKRVVKQIKTRNVDPNTTFDDFITDAKSVLEYFKQDERFSKIHVIGHSQGSLVGMIAAKDYANGFISIAGAGQSIDNVIVNQIAAMDSSLVSGTQKAFDKLRKGETTNDYPLPLSSIFRADIQPFIINWMKYDPAKKIAELDIPVLIVNGTKDLQVSEEEANLLKNASDNSSLRIIKDMNHVLFIIKGDTLENSKSYNESSRPVSQELIDTISGFINKS